MDTGLFMYYMDKPKLNMSQKLVVYIFSFYVKYLWFSKYIDKGIGLILMLIV